MTVFISPSGNPEVHDARPDGYFDVEEWEDAHMTDEERKAKAVLKAQEESQAMLVSVMQRNLVQSEIFTKAQNAVFLKAGLFPDWTPEAEYATGNRIAYDGAAYEVQQPVTAQVHQTPGSTGMLAVYRPISANDDEDGSKEKPFAFILGIDVCIGKHYLYNSKLYLAKADMLPCIWNPDTPGLWQWEEVEG